jgi:predicted dehydrogenase
MVGAGRSRNGLGPFLAEFLEAAGFAVVGVAGRSPERAAANAEALSLRLGHEVEAFASLAALCGSRVAALAIASPAESHLEALQAGAEAGLPTLCEKPLVHESDGQQGAAVIETFARERLPLLENCQWPYVLPAFVQLHGQVRAGEEVRVAMGLGPPRRGREIVQNTVSHLLSVIQAVGALDPAAVVTDVHLDDPTYTGTHNVLRFRLAGPGRTVEGALHLEICVAPPRPAWLAIDGRRMDRRVGEGHSIAFSGNNREVTIGDPMKELVKHFALLVRSRDPVLVDLDLDLVRQRLDWYRQILGKLE